MDIDKKHNDWFTTNFFIIPITKFAHHRVYHKFTIDMSTHFLPSHTSGGIIHLKRGAHVFASAKAVRNKHNKNKFSSWAYWSARNYSTCPSPGRSWCSPSTSRSRTEPGSHSESRGQCCNCHHSIPGLLCPASPELHTGKLVTVTPFYSYLHTHCKPLCPCYLWQCRSILHIVVNNNNNHSDHNKNNNRFLIRCI